MVPRTLALAVAGGALCDGIGGATEPTTAGSVAAALVAAVFEQLGNASASAMATLSVRLTGADTPRSPRTPRSRAIWQADPARRSPPARARSPSRPRSTRSWQGRSRAHERQRSCPIAAVRHAELVLRARRVGGSKPLAPKRGPAELTINPRREDPSRLKKILCPLALQRTAQCWLALIASTTFQEWPSSTVFAAFSVHRRATTTGPMSGSVLVHPRASSRQHRSSPEMDLPRCPGIGRSR